MTVVCPSGHASATSDYCDQCGAPIARGVVAQPTEVLPAVEDEDTSPAVQREPCPVCGSPRSGDDRYCEGCGHDFLAPPRTSVGWEAIISADRVQFDHFAASSIQFPSDFVERRFELDGPAVRIGRSRGPAGGSNSAPEIDLAGTSEDPGVSRLHAVLERQADGSYAVRDLGSTNGTTVNDDPAPVATDAAKPLADGDRVRVGAWTTITVRAI